MVSNDFLKTILNTLLGNTSSASCYLALSSTLPNRNGSNVNEPSGNGYERKLLGSSSQTRYMSSATEVFDPETGLSTNTVASSNNQEIHFNEATGDWGTLGYFAIYSSKTGGTMLYSGTLTAEISPSVGHVVTIGVGELTITLSANDVD